MDDDAPFLSRDKERAQAALEAALRQQKQEQESRDEPKGPARKGSSLSDMKRRISRLFADSIEKAHQKAKAELIERERQNAERKAARARLAEQIREQERRGPVNKNRITFLSLVEEIKIHAEKCVERYNQRAFIPHIVESYNDRSFNLRSEDGEAVYRRLVEVFVSFPEPPTHFQHKLFTATMSACAPLIFGNAFFTDPERYMRLIDGGRFTDGIVGILTGRKTGKSTGLAYIAICLMMVISGFNGIISSKTLEQAKIILQSVKAFIIRHPIWRAGGYEIIETRATALIIKGPDGTLRSLSARCGSGEVRVPPPPQLPSIPFVLGSLVGRGKNSISKVRGSDGCVCEIFPPKLLAAKSHEQKKRG